MGGFPERFFARSHKIPALHCSGRNGSLKGLSQMAEKVLETLEKTENLESSLGLADEVFDLDGMGDLENWLD